MPRSLPLLLVGLAASLVSSPSLAQMSLTPGAQCRPAVANEAMYHNCRIRIVNGSEVCRCRIAASAGSQSRAAQQSDSDGLTTGSISRAGGQFGSGVVGTVRGAPFSSRANSSVSSVYSPAGTASGTAGVSGAGSLSAGGVSPASGAGSGGGAPVAGNTPAPGSTAREQDNAGIGNGWEGSDISDAGGAEAVAASGIDTSRGDPDNPGHGRSAGASPGMSGNAGKSGSAPGRTM